MSITLATLVFLMDGAAPWRADWLWGLPLIVVTVIFHVLGLGFLSRKAILFHDNMKEPRRVTIESALVVGAMTLLATVLHAIETAFWAIAYCLLGALPNPKMAMLYSLGAMTTYGHDNLYLADHWRLLGTIEALNGWLLFGLSTAFLFWLIQELSPNYRSQPSNGSQGKDQ
jgi:hypothetical protein